MVYLEYRTYPSGLSCGFVLAASASKATKFIFSYVTSLFSRTKRHIRKNLMLNSETVEFRCSEHLRHIFQRLTDFLNSGETKLRCFQRFRHMSKCFAVGYNSDETKLRCFHFLRHILKRLPERL